MGHTPCPSLPKHNLSMQQRVFSLQIEDSLQPASNQTGVNDEKSSEDEPPTRMRARTLAERMAPAGRALMQNKQVVLMWSMMTNNINPHWRTMLILFAIQLPHKKEIDCQKEVPIQRTNVFKVLGFRV